MKKISKERKKILKNLGKKIHAIRYFPAGIICGPHRGSFAVRDHLRFNLGIISGLGIICGRGSFAALYNNHKFMMKSVIVRDRLLAFCNQYFSRKKEC